MYLYIYVHVYITFFYPIIFSIVFDCLVLCYVMVCFIILYLFLLFYRRKFRSQTSNNMDRWKSRGRKRRAEERRSEKRKSQRKEDAGARREESRETLCLPMICSSGGSKSRLAKAAGAEPAGQMRDSKLHAVVVRSTFPSKNVQNTPAPEHFEELRCRKSARRCGAKHMSVQKTDGYGALLDVQMSLCAVGTRDCAPGQK